MIGDKFRDGLSQLLEIAGNKRTVMVCAEGLFRPGRRRLACAFLLVNGVTVRHICPNGEVQLHKLSGGAKLTGQNISYPETYPLFDTEGS